MLIFLYFNSGSFLTIREDLFLKKTLTFRTYIFHHHRTHNTRRASTHQNSLDTQLQSHTAQEHEFRNFLNHLKKRKRRDLTRTCHQERKRYLRGEQNTK